LKVSHKVLITGKKISLIEMRKTVGTADLREKIKSSLQYTSLRRQLESEKMQEHRGVSEPLF
jgi:hypothetical protein